MPLADTDKVIKTLDGKDATLFIATIRAGDDSLPAAAFISVARNGVFGFFFLVAALVTGGAYTFSVH
jgi:hypothetical protein